MAIRLTTNTHYTARDSPRLISRASALRYSLIGTCRHSRSVEQHQMNAVFDVTNSNEVSVSSRLCIKLQREIPPCSCIYDCKKHLLRCTATLPSLKGPLDQVSKTVCVWFVIAKRSGHFGTPVIYSWFSPVLDFSI